MFKDHVFEVAYNIKHTLENSLGNPKNKNKVFENSMKSNAAKTGKLLKHASANTRSKSDKKD